MLENKLQAQQHSKHKYSLVIPVFNRPDEVQELLESICNMNITDIPFEVVIVEDGSTMPCKDVVDKYSSKINLQYFMLEKNSGSCAMPRNIGAEKASGDYLIFTDSDVLLPPNYLKEVDNMLVENDLDAFGGPDMAHDSFNNLQKATSYAMTSFFTTGGIRSKKQSLGGKYYPRGFNYGVKKDVFLKLGRFPLLFPGEDMMLSFDIVKQNYTIGFIEKAGVYHKRRTSIKKFFRQVYTFGRGRINLNILYPETAKLVFYLPTLFTLFCLFCIVSSFVCAYAIAPILLYAMLVFVDSSMKNKSVTIGGLSVITAFVQH